MRPRPVHQICYSACLRLLGYRKLYVSAPLKYGSITGSSPGFYHGLSANAQTIIIANLIIRYLTLYCYMLTERRKVKEDKSVHIVFGESDQQNWRTAVTCIFQNSIVPFGFCVVASNKFLVSRLNAAVGGSKMDVSGYSHCG